MPRRRQPPRIPQNPSEGGSHPPHESRPTLASGKHYVSRKYPIQEIAGLCDALDTGDMNGFRNQAAQLSGKALSECLKLCELARDRGSTTERGQLIETELKNERKQRTTQSVEFSMVTWNVEHHGFTSNARGGSKPWWNGVSATNAGYSESQEELTHRLENVVNEIHSGSCGPSSPSLVGFNEIGILAFEELEKLLRPDYAVFTAVSDIAAELASDHSVFYGPTQLSGMVDATRGRRVPVRFRGSAPDLQNVYGNVIGIDTRIWKIIDIKVIYFQTAAHRSNTAIVSRLQYNEPGGAEILWMHTHLKYTSEPNLDEKRGQIEEIQQWIAGERSRGNFNIIISGDLYLDSLPSMGNFREALTNAVGMQQLHRFQTQRFSQPPDADHILIPNHGNLNLSSLVSPTLLGDWGQRKRWSDHSGVCVHLELHGSGEDDTKLPGAYARVPHSRRTTSKTTNVKDRIRQLYGNMRSFTPK